MLVVFEGIDGSGKTTLSNRVAKVLARRGVDVRHVREGGRLNSPTAEAIRLFARDQRNAALSPVAEMLLYAARDAQQLDEAMRPALADADVVIADRFAYTALVMATTGRGVPLEQVRPVVDAVARDVTPDLMILVDAEPHIARARRRVSKIVEPTSRPPSRKGLSGEGLMQRLRGGYRALAQAHPESWVIVDNTDADLDATVDGLVAAIDALRAGGGVAGARAALAATVARSEPAPAPTDLRGARAAFLDWVDGRSAREPGLAAYFMGGLAGPDYDQRRLALVERVPAIIADGLGGLDDAVTWGLRQRLAKVAPGIIVRGLWEAAGRSPAAWALREQLVALAPAEVASSLRGLHEARAWVLRERLTEVAPLAVLASLSGDGSTRAWRWRESWLAHAGGEDAFVDPLAARAACHSVSGLAGEKAWAWRRHARLAAPAAALASLYRLTDEQAWTWRREWLARAPRPVLRSLDGLDDERAHELRQHGLPVAPEAIGSLRGLDSQRARALREAAVARWPVAVAKSLAGPLAATPRGQALLRRLLARHPTHVGLWKHIGAAVLP